MDPLDTHVLTFPNPKDLNFYRDFSFSPHRTQHFVMAEVGKRKGRHSTMTRSHPSERRKAKLRLNLWKIHHNQPGKGKISCGKLKNLWVEVFSILSTSAIIPCDGLISARVFKFGRRRRTRSSVDGGEYFILRLSVMLGDNLLCRSLSRAIFAPDLYAKRKLHPTLDSFVGIGWGEASPCLKVNFTAPGGQLINYFLYSDADVGVKAAALINFPDGRRWHEAETRSFSSLAGKFILRSRTARMTQLKSGADFKLRCLQTTSSSLNNFPENFIGKVCNFLAKSWFEDWHRLNCCGYPLKVPFNLILRRVIRIRAILMKLSP